MKKVKIYTIAFNRPELIALQCQSFVKHIKDNFEFIVFNNAPTKEYQVRNQQACDALGIGCIGVDIAGISKHPSRNHASVLNWAFHNYIKNEKKTIALILDSDMFVVKDLSVNTYFKGYDVAGFPQVRENITYLFPGIMVFNLDGLPHKDDIDFMLGDVKGIRTDTGGKLWYWLNSNPGLKVYHMSQGKWNVVDYVGIVPEKIIEKYKDKKMNRFLVIDQFFLHYRHASNYYSHYIEEEYYFWKTKLLSEFLSQQ